MKPITALFTIITVLFSIASQAQTPVFDLGIKAGANFEQLSGTPRQQAYEPGVAVGLYLEVRSKKIGVQVEGLINTANYAFKGVDYYNNNYPLLISLRAKYLSIPILFQYKLIRHLWLQVGPQYSHLLSMKGMDYIKIEKVFIRPDDVGGVLGLELKLPFRLNMGARYILGFSNVNPGNATGAWHTSSIQAHIGFTFLRFNSSPVQLR
jgi:hypothetical protein